MSSRFHPLALLAAARGRLRALFDRSAVEHELDEEMRFHLEMEVAKNVQGGMSADEARRAAVIAFGGVDRMTEAHRDARGTRVIEDAVSDMRYAARSLARAPGLVAVSVLTLTVAIAIGTSLFTAVNAFFYRPLPVPEGDRMIAVYTSDFDGRQLRGGSSYADLVTFNEAVRGLAQLTGETRFSAGITVGDKVSLLPGALVASNYFSTLRIRPSIGSFPASASAEMPAIVLSQTLWRRSFASDTSVVGRRVAVNGAFFTVAAVVDPEFRGIQRESSAEFWIDAALSPLVLPREDVLNRRGNRRFHIVGRLGQSTPEAVESRLALAATRLLQEDPRTWRDTTGHARRVTVIREQDAITSGVGSGEVLLAVGGVVALGLALLAIACTNLASMQMARAAARRREIATRLALGADRGRLIRQLLAESMMIAVPGVVAGLGLSLLLTSAVSRYRPIGFPSLDLSLDPRVLLFVGSALVLALLLFGLVPALQTVRADVLTDLKGGEQPGPTGIRVGGVRGGLIIAQVALSVTFTAASGLVAFALIRDANQGRDEAKRVIVAPMTFLPAAGDSARVATLVREMVEAAAALPGVEAASAARFIPIRGARMTISAELRGASGRNRTEVLDANGVRSGYFGVAGLKILRGRDFNESDVNARHVAIVSQEMAKYLWPGEDALGKRLRTDSEGSTVEVIGVVSDSPTPAGVPGVSNPGLLYVPLRVESEGAVVLEARARPGVSGDVVATQLSRELQRRATRVVSPDVVTLDRYLSSMLLPQRIMAQASAVLAALQFLLAVAGLSGLVAYVTALRRREIGIRGALGAPRASVIALVMRQGIRLTSIGGAIGLLLSVGVGRVVTLMLPTTVGLEAAAIAVAIGAFAIVGGLGMLIPARRALGVTPAAALRVE